MMFLKQISVVNYKNILSQAYAFSPTINCFVGDNGVGKTNLLDAIYHLGMAKSYFTTSAAQSVRHGEEFYLIEGQFRQEEREEQIVCSLKKGQKKVMKHNGKAYERLADHIGKYPMVLISPSDRDLIVESSETRRKFLDSVISQTDRAYLELLLRYNRTLLQRNTLLKQMAEGGVFSLETLHIYDEQVAHLKKNAISIIVAITIGAMVGIGSIVGVGHLLGVKSSLIASLAPKSVTTPIAMELAGNNGGIPGLTAVIVVCAGIIGSIIGPPIMKLMKIKSPVAKGLAMGASSHGIGTAAAIQMGAIEGALSGLAIGIMGLMTSILLPLFARWFG
mgnify:CR=1 FL=1